MNKAILFTVLFSLTIACPNARAQKPELVVPTGHGQPVFSLKFSPDDNYLASSDNIMIKLWDVKKEKEIKTFSGLSFDFSSDGKYIATGNWDGFVNILEIESGIITKSFKLSDNPIFYINYSYDDRYFILCTQDSILIFNILSEKIKSFSGMGFARLSRDNNYCIGVNSDTMLCLWNLEKEKPEKIFSKTDGYLDWGKAVTRNCSLVAYVNNNSNVFSNIFVMNAWTGKMLLNIDRKNNCFPFLSFSDDNTLLMISSACENGNNEINIFEIHTGKIIKSINKDNAFRSIFSHSGQWIAISNLETNDIEIWDLKQNCLIKTLKSQCAFIENLKLSFDMKRLFFCGYNNHVKSIEPFKNNNISVYKESNIGNRLSFCLSTNSNQFVVYPSSFELKGDKATIYNIVNDTIVKRNVFDEEKNYDTKLISFPNNSKYIVYNIANIVEVRNSSSLENIYTFVNDKDITDVNISPNNEFIICSQIDGYFLKWSLTDGKKLLQFGKDSSQLKPARKIFSISPDSKYLSCFYDSTIELWNLLDGRLIKKVSSIYDLITYISYSFDGNYIATAIDKNYGVDKVRIKVWDNNFQKEICTLNGHKEIITSLDFSKDATNLLYSSSLDCNIKIWDVSTGKELVTIIPLDSTDWAVVAPDGRFDASPNGMKLLYYVQGLEVLPLESFFEKYYTPGLLKQVLENPDLRTDQRGPVDFRKTLRLPPKVAISSNMTETTTNMTQARIFLQVSDAGGGIDEVRLYQNGKLLPDELILDKKTTNVGRKQEITYSVPLVSGKNEFKATGFNLDRTESIPVNHVINRNAVESSINLYLVSIGINTYKNAVYNLSYAKPDAEAFVKKVDQYSSELFKKIVKYEFYDHNATRTNIEDAIGKITAESRPEDVFVFYYAGHGVMSEEEDGLPAEFYLIPHDVVKMYGRNDLLSTKGLSASWLKDNCAKIKAQKQLVLLDACHSGGAVESFAMLRNAATEKAILQLARSAGITVLAAAGTEQGAAEFAQLGHGVFTFALLEGLDGYADGKKDGKVTVKEIEAYLNDRVPALTLQYRGVEQYPNGFSRGQDFPIGVVKK